ncbi:MAG TPA: 2,3-dihydro-2,3-dihydroxybenzoate dehydrogenase [Pseudonocardiaceae bacterium]|jgi:2,3-dihydro-2,3-dihydroxybenzoate dehydrogenase|nr:2,3-dihydro-2,3-dihydroxybenzoate dehydrogenase [Pseudonocardiaceae bacterium]
MTTGLFHGRTALVTGAAQGIGAAVAALLACQGARVAAVDAHPGRLEDTVAGLRAEGHDVTAHPCDVTDSAAVEAMVDGVESRLGPVGILVNVAGVLRTAAAVDLTDDDWRSMFDVNTSGVFYTSRAVAKRMMAYRSGVIVTVASNAGGVPRTSMAGYSASKAASSLFTRCLGLELAEYGIRCNVVSPGSTDTPMLHSMWDDESGRQATLKGSLATYKLGIPLGKLAQTRDVAEAVCFLASDAAGHITMQDLYVDGGASLHG